MKILILCLLTTVVISLGFALRAMTSTTVSRQQTANALTIRVVLSIGLLVVMLISWKMGWIEPHNAG